MSCECACCKPEVALRVVEAIEVTPEVMSVKLLKPPEFLFKAGQYVLFKLKTKSYNNGTFYSIEGRRLSMASSPKKGYLQFAAKRSESSFKKAFFSLKEGDEVSVAGPTGSFVIEPTNHLVLMAGGIGVTPLKSMAEYATDMKFSMNITFLYSNKTLEDIAYKEELDNLARQNSNLKIIYTLTQPEKLNASWQEKTGRINEAMIQEAIPNLGNAIFYICGPPGMVSGLQQALIKLGIDQEQIRYENFTGY